MVFIMCLIQAAGLKNVTAFCVGSNMQGFHQGHLIFSRKFTGWLVSRFFAHTSPENERMCPLAKGLFQKEN